ncbi:hypothetical protein GH714_011035 [Hevea brasiliensis]|uniref:Uncharacterized protein n=1 Tax=Hevea brasiliensis TaxID=3981 RepID=A0A6A6N3V0_HEVBR|nr:hypothetical protein GH714_011035 [Hevea brasiliensis]
MALETILAIVPTVIECTFGPVKRHLSYAFNYKSKVEKLKNQIKKLTSQRDGLQQSVDQATRQGDRINDNVQEWLTSVNKAIEEAEEAVIGEEQAKERCFFGVIPNLKKRYQLSKKAEKEALAVVELQGEGRFDRISYRPLLEPIVTPSVYDNEALHSRVSILKKVMDALMDPDVNMIGVYGMGGIGKTTLANEIHRKAIEDKLFDVVVMATVSETPELRKIQGTIADMLGMKLEEETEEGRACRLRQRLINEKKILIILDDIWEQLEPRNSEKSAGLPVLIVTVARALKNKDLHEWKDALKELSRVDNEGIQAKVYSALELSYNHLASDEVKSFFLLCALFAQSDIRVRDLLLYGIGLDLLRSKNTVEDARNRVDKLISGLKASCLLLDGEKNGSVKMHDVVRDAALSIASKSQLLFTFRDIIESKEWPTRDLRNCSKISLPYCEIHELPEQLECPELELLVLGKGYIHSKGPDLKISDLFFERITKLKIRKGYDIQYVVNSTKRVPCNAFPVLESLSLWNLASLEKICHCQLTTGSFTRLRILKVRECNRLKNLFSISMVRNLSQLQEMEVSYCESMEEIVVDESEVGDDKIEVAEFTQLRSLELRRLPVLKSFCFKVKELPILQTQSTSDGGFKEIALQDEIHNPLPLFDEMVSFPNLEKLSVYSVGCENKQHDELFGVSSNPMRSSVLACPDLKYLFTTSFVKSLLQLQKLYIQDCDFMEGIVLTEEFVEERMTKILFPNLDELNLKNLSNLTRFCDGHLIDFCSLTKLSIEKCPAFRTFVSNPLCADIKVSKKPKEVDLERNQDTTFPPLFDEKVFISLEELSLDGETIETILQCQLPKGFLSKVKSVQLYHIHEKSTVSLFGFLQRLPDLESLFVRESSLKELLRNEGLDDGEKEDDGTTLPLIRNLNLYHLQNLEHIWKPHPRLDIVLEYVETMTVRGCTNLINITPSSASFRNLTTLEVGFCKALKHLVTSATAKSMVQLMKMKIRTCKILTEIVTDERDGRTEEIVFSRLKTLELIHLKSLEGFCLGSLTFKFPCLEVVTVSGCPNMRTFSVGVLSTPKLQCVHLHEMHFQSWRWEGNLNATVQKSYLEMEGFYQISLSSNQMPFLKRLEVLIVEQCDSIEEIFDLGGMNADEGHVGLMPWLQELHLIDLPQLRHIWNKDPQGILSFENLKLLKVYNCSSLTNILTLPMALGLVRLERMEVKRCTLLEQIINKEGEKEDEGEWDKTIFPSLHTINLESLPSLTSFFSGSDVLRCPSLNKVDIVDCPKMLNPFPQYR